MSRVLLVCPEPLGHGQPAGIGIRFLEMARVLRDDGHAVTILSPDAGAVDGCTSAHIDPDTLLATSTASDVAVVQGHVANAFFLQAAPLPTVVDLYDPYIIENLHYYSDRGSEVFRHDHFTLMSSLTRGDFFLCASEAQRMFYLGAMLAAGRLNPEIFEKDPQLSSLIAIAPFGVPPSLVDPHPGRLSSPGSILFGGIYDWYDPITAIEAVAIARRSAPELTLTFTRHPNPDLTPQGKLAEAMEHVRVKGYDFVRFEPWAAYERRAEFFAQFSLALLTFDSSLETDLSMRTRVYDYLWCGLPVVTSSAPGIDEILVRYESGIVVPRGGADAFAAAILRAGRDRPSRRTADFVRDHQWERTLEPLREFVRTPRMEQTRSTFAMQPAIPERPVSILRRLKRRLRA